MKVTEQLAARVATLARLQLAEEERAAYATQLGALLEYFEQLQQLDTGDIEPTAHAVRLHCPRRADEQGTGPLPLTTEALLARAPEQQDGLFVVPKVID